MTKKTQKYTINGLARKAVDAIDASDATNKIEIEDSNAYSKIVVKLTKEEISKHSSFLAKEIKKNFETIK